jgi:hypothetical protein
MYLQNYFFGTVTFDWVHWVQIAASYVFVGNVYV